MKTKIPIEQTAKRVYEFIARYDQKNGRSPTQQEIANHFGRQRRGAPYTHSWTQHVLKILERDGKIESIPGKRRNIKVK